MNNMNIPRKKQLTTLYSKGYSMKEIGEILGMATGKIHKYFKIYNIIPRKISNEFSKIKISEANKGVSRGKGKILSEETKEKLSIINSVGIGRKVMHNGYVRIYFPDHPKADKRGWILEHDLIMECNIGRWLKPNEVVHHKNRIKNDNRIENLQLMTNSEHMRLHRLEKINEKRSDDLLTVL